MRVGGFTRYGGPQDYLDLCEAAQHIVVKHGELAQFARRLGARLPPGWRPLGADAHLEQLALRLAGSRERRKLVAFILPRSVVVYASGLPIARFAVPAAQQSPVPAARVHGMLVGQSLGLPDFVPSSHQQLDDLGKLALQAAYHGCESSPRQFPTPAFRALGSWRQ